MNHLWTTEWTLKFISGAVNQLQVRSLNIDVKPAWWKDKRSKFTIRPEPILSFMNVYTIYEHPEHKQFMQFYCVSCHENQYFIPFSAFCYERELSFDNENSANTFFVNFWRFHFEFLTVSLWISDGFFAPISQYTSVIEWNLSNFLNNAELLGND